MRRPGLAIALGAIALATLCSAAGAQARWALRTYYGYVDIQGDGNAAFTIVSRPETLNRPLVIDGQIRMDRGEGLGLGVEYRASDLLGIELGGLRSNLDTDLALQGGRFVGAFDVSFVPVFLGLNFHLLPRESRLDLFAGAFAGRFFYSEDARIRFDDDVYELRFADDDGWGLNLGLDIEISASFAVVLGARWFDSDTQLSVRAPPELDADVPTGIRVEVQPIVYSLGLGLRF